jgi:hypothetical protein
MVNALKEASQQGMGVSRRQYFDELVCYAKKMKIETKRFKN